jgi:hypothetical protein
MFLIWKHRLQAENETAKRGSLVDFNFQYFRTSILFLSLNALGSMAKGNGLCNAIQQRTKIIK